MSRRADRWLISFRVETAHRRRDLFTQFVAAIGDHPSFVTRFVPN